MSDRAMSLERSPPRARFETVHPETPEQTSATRPAPAVTTNGASQQNPPQAGGGVGQDPSSDRPEQATPPKRDEEVEDADAADTFVAEYDVNPEEDARGDAADRATNHDGWRDSENLAFREGGAHPYVEDESMGESEDERSDSDTDSDSDDDDDRTDEDEDAVVDEALTDDDPQGAASAQSYLDLRTGFHEAGHFDTYVDTTAAQAAAGRDIQGIPWDRLQFTREQYREKRVREYKNYANLDFSVADVEAACALTPTRPASAPYFEFAHNTRSVRSNFVHFQLRNLVWSTSAQDAYVVSENKVMHWNARAREASTVLDLDGGSSRSGGVTVGDFPRIQVSTTCVKDGLVAAGGFAGELVVLATDTGASASTRVTQDDNGITNAVEFFATRSGAEVLVCSNNDQMTRFYDLATMRCLGRHKYPWAVNYASPTRCGRLMAVVGDSKEAWLVDPGSGRRTAKVEGHLDYSFAAAWHPDGRVFATGNQDTTTRVWDARHLGQSLAVLRGRMGAIRSLRFSRDGRFLAAAEPADFVHVYDVVAGFTESQTLDHFGETAGVAFSPDGEALFVGVADLTYGSVLEYERTRRGNAAVVV